MAKVNVSITTDYKGVTCYQLEKKRGTISQREAYEAMEAGGYFGQFLMDFPIPQDVPFDLYEPGDCLLLYKVEDLLGKKAEDEFNKGYEACLKDHHLEE